MRYLILTSPTTSKNISQASIFYLKPLLSGGDAEVDILDLSGAVDFYDPPRELFENQLGLWQSALIFDESWIDKYIPVSEKRYDYIYASALFSMDIILQGRYVKRCKEINPKVNAIIGGPAVKNLDNNQLRVISSVFDGIPTGSLYIRPDYNLNSYRLKEFVTIATGIGCDWGKCRFCNSGKEAYLLRDLDEIVEEFICISQISDSDIMLSSDSMTINKINDLSLKLSNVGNKQKYNFMMRASKGVDNIFSENLKRSGCTDVFIGGEILNDLGLALIDKGITVATIKETAKNLNSAGINVQLGLILFLPLICRISERQLENQLRNLEEILPYINRVELESLSVLYNSFFYKHNDFYGIDLYPEKNLIFPMWCYGLSPDVPWGFTNDNDYFIWERHINSLRSLLGNYVDEKYWWHIDYIKESWEK